MDTERIRSEVIIKNYKTAQQKIQSTIIYEISKQGRKTVVVY